MINQNCKLLRIVSLIYLLLFTIEGFAQNETKILNIKNGFGDQVPSVKIKLILNDDENSETTKTYLINDPIESKATIEVIGEEGITVVLKSFNGTIVEIPATYIMKYEITNDNENYKIETEHPTKKVIINKLKEYLGKVTAFGPKEEIEANTYGTIFSLSLADDDLEIELIEGKLNLNHLIKREIKDNSVIGKDSKRAIFVREIKQLTVEEGIYPGPNNLGIQSLLTNDKEIKRFLRKPFKIQRKILINKGGILKKGI